MYDSDCRVSIEDDLQGLNMDLNRTQDPFILRLPAELASEIFLFCLEPRSAREIFERYVSDHWHDDTDGLTPSEIVSICKGWRAIALSTPQLWCHIRVSLRSCYSPYHEFLEDLLLRSGSLPLSFILADEELMKYGTSANSVINLLNQHSARWHNVVLFVSPFHMSGLRGNPNAFSDLVIKSPPRSYYGDPPPEVPVRHLGGQFDLRDTSPPAPRCVFVEDGTLPFHRLHISWANAAVITLHAIFITEFLQLLSSTPQLEELTVSISAGDENNDSLMVTNSSLKRLNTSRRPGRTWNDHDGPSISDIFSWITLPSIEQLTLYNFPSGLRSLSAFASRSSCDLRSLHLQSCHGSYAETIAELCQIPSISCLRLEDTSLDMKGAGDFLRELAHTKSHEKTGIPSDMLLPNLVSLEMDVKQPVNWSLVPGIILPLPEQQNPVFQYRPLTNLIIWICSHTPNHDYDFEDKVYIPEYVLDVLQSFIDHRGYDLNIQYDNGLDFMQDSRMYHADQLLERAERGGEPDEEEDRRRYLYDRNRARGRRGRLQWI